jgi:hypothetical protein
VYKTALEPAHPPSQWVQGALSLGVKRSGREADHSSPSSAEVEWVELYLHSPNIPSKRGAQLYHKDNFTFTFYRPEVMWKHVTYRKFVRMDRPKYWELSTYFSNS